LKNVWKWIQSFAISKRFHILHNKKTKEKQIWNRDAFKQRKCICSFNRLDRKI
jgi:hypothetical protein